MAKKTIKKKDLVDYEVVQWDGTNLQEIRDFIAPLSVVEDSETQGTLLITTLYGRVIRVSTGLHIVKSTVIDVYALTQNDLDIYYKDK